MLISLLCGAGLGGACASSGAGSERTPRRPGRQERCCCHSPPSLLGSKAAKHVVCSILLTQHRPASPAGCYSRSSHFPAYLLTAFLAPQASALAEHVTKEAIEIHCIIRAGFQGGRPGHLHFTFSFICARLMCLSFVLICFRDYRTPALALPL